MPEELAQLRKDIEQFPKAVTATLGAIAWRKARDVKELARRLAPRDETLARGRHTRGHPHLADSIVIEEDVDQKAFRVFPETPWLPNLGLWKEYGTVHVPATPFMRPAGDAVNPSYQREMEAGAKQVAEQVLNR